MKRPFEEDCTKATAILVENGKVTINPEIVIDDYDIDDIIRVVEKELSLQNPASIIDIDLDYKEVYDGENDSKCTKVDLSIFERCINLTSLRISIPSWEKNMIRMDGIHSLITCTKLCDLDLCTDVFDHDEWDSIDGCDYTPRLFINDCIPKATTSECIKDFMALIHSVTREYIVSTEEYNGDTSFPPLLDKVARDTSAFTDVDVYKMFWKWNETRPYTRRYNDDYTLKEYWEDDPYIIHKL